MKRVLLLALTAALLLSTLVASGVGVRMAWDAVFEQEDTWRKEALSAAVGRTEGESLRFFGQKTMSETNRYIVRFADHMPWDVLMEALEGKPYSLLADSGERVFAVCLDDAARFESIYGDFLVYCCKDRVLSTLAVSADPHANELDAYAPFALGAAWELGSASDTVTVAVLDTGIDRAHEDFAGANILDGYDAVEQKTGVSEDTDGHGTAVAGLIAAADNGVGTAGVAFGVTLLPIRVSSDANRIYSSDLIAGIRFAADAGADILNLSFGGYTYSAAEYDAVSYAIGKGCILIAAAGNDGETTQAGMPVYPAAYEGVISVGSCDRDGVRSAFSQNNDSVDVLAPGQDLFLLSVGEETYRTDSGTSFSAAIVSGVAALVLSELDDGVRFEGAELVSLLADGRRSATGTGHGAVNAHRALQNVNTPQIVGIEMGKTYTEKVTVRFNRGTATLDGEPFSDGDTVYQNGIHVLTVTDGAFKKSVHFRLSYTPASFEKQETADGVAYVYDGGTATVDGIPYVSGTVIADAGYHIFCLTDSMGETQTEQFYCKGAFPIAEGITDGGVYEHPVRIRITGDGTALLDGQPFGNAGIVREDGEHVLTLTDGVREETYRFTLQTGATFFDNNLSRSGVIAPDGYGWYAVYSEMLTGIRIYDCKTGAYCGFVGTETVNGYAFADGLLLIFGEWQLTVLDPAQMLAGDPRVASYSVRCQGFGYVQGVLYCLADGELCTVSVADGSMQTVLQTDATEILCTETALWLYSAQENRFDRLQDGVWTSFVPPRDVRDLRKRAENGWLFCGGYALRVPEDGDALELAFVFDGYAVGMHEGLLFGTGGAYRLEDGMHVGGFGESVSCVLPTPAGTYVCGMLGDIRLYPHGLDLQYGFAPYEGGVCTEPYAGGAYTEQIYLYGNAHPSAMQAFGDRFGAVFYAERTLILYRLGVKASERVLPFFPDGLALGAESTCVWSRQHGLLWLDGMLMDAGMEIENAFFVSDTLYVQNGEILYTLTDGAFADTGIRVQAAVGMGSLMAWTYGGMLHVSLDGGETQSIPCTQGVLMTDGRYVLCGKTVYFASDLSVTVQNVTDAFAMGAGTLLTKHGLYALTSGRTLSSFDASGCKTAAVGGRAGVVFYSGNTLTVTRSMHDLSAEPFTDGIPRDGLADGSATIFADSDYVYLDGVLYENGSAIVSPGAHVLTLVLPCFVVWEYRFTVVPHLESIAFSVGTYRLAAGESDVLHVLYLPEGTSSIPVKYTLDGDCVQLHADGSFTALHEGEAVVTAQTEDGALVAACRIIVSASLLRFAPEAGYRINRESDILFGVPEGTSADVLLSHVLSDGEVTVSDTLLRTGTQVVLYSADGMELDRLTVAITGDTDGDGYVTVHDLSVLEDALQSGRELSADMRFACDINASGSVTNRDATELRDRLLYVTENDRLLPSAGTHEALGMFMLSSVCVGDTLDVTLYLREDVQADGLGGRLYFDSSLLRFEKIIDYGYGADAHADPYYISFLLSGKPFSAGMPLLTLRFVITKECKNSELRLCDMVLSDADAVCTLPETAHKLTAQSRTFGETSLHVIGMTGYFDPAVTEYDVYVPLGTIALDYTVRHPENCTVTVRNTVFGTGDTLTAVFTIRNENAENTTYIVHAHRTDDPQIPVDTTLSSLQIDGVDIDFDRDVTEYTFTVPFETEKLNLTWTASSPYATVKCSDTALTEGEYNEIVLTVLSPDGTQTVYTLTVYRTPLSGESDDSTAESIPDQSHASQNSTVSTPPITQRRNGWVWLIPLFLLIAGGSVIVWMARNEKNKQKEN